MGEPIMLDLIIENLQKVLGMRSSVVITGLRDGEKMNEDLFGPNEKSFTTVEPRIKGSNLDFELKNSAKLLTKIVDRDEDFIINELLKMTTVKYL